MLILARKIGEEIIITTPEGRRIVMKLASIDRNVVRLGFDAPHEVEVFRAEVYEKYHASRVAAAAKGVHV